MNNDFTFRRIGSTGCEILCEGIVVAWSADEDWAAVIVARLNTDPFDAVALGLGLPIAACCCRGSGNRIEDDTHVKE